MKNHYETLGVSRTASVEEIKRVYRKLSLETHPDVASSSCDERFKQISQAHGILTNAKQRRLYDLKLKESKWRRPPPNRGGGVSSSGASSHSAFVEGFFRPRNVLIGIVLGVGTVTLFQNVFGTKKQQGDNLVEAWKNPQTGQWETPAPWDVAYQQTKPKLFLIPRDQVRPRHFN